MPLATKMWLSLSGFYSLSHTTIWSCRLAGSHDRLKTLYFHYHHSYGHKTFQDGELPRAASTNYVTWSYNNVVKWDHWELKAWNLPYRNVYGRTTSLERLLPFVSHDHVITWSCEIIWQAKNFLSSLLECLWPQKLAGCWLTLSNVYL